MKYCVEYGQAATGFRYLNEVDELTITYRSTDTSLVDFMLAHSNQRINVYIKDSADFVTNNRIKLFEACREEHPELNFVFKLNEVQESKDLLQLLVEKNFKFFFAYHIFDWDTLWGVIKLNPTDVYITDSLGFEIKTASAIVHEAGIAVRVYPNVAQSRWGTTSGLMKFFIRPEDVPVYEPYVDTMEFFTLNPKKLSTYYKIYVKDKKWFGNLNEMIIDLSDDIDSRCLLPNFAERRLNCGKRCLKGRKCVICAATVDLAQKLSTNNLTIKTLSKKNAPRPPEATN